MSPTESPTFAVLDVTPQRLAATPSLTARIGIAAPGPDPVHAIALRAQVRIQPGIRSYNDAEATGLIDLFGPRERWDDTQRSMLWMHCATMVPGFTGATEIDLPMPCTYDFEVSASKYLHALRDGAVPLIFLFSGTTFSKTDIGFTVAQIPWDREDSFALPVGSWQELMSLHYPNSGWLRLERETLDALATYKSSHGLLGFDDAITDLLAHDREEVR